MINALAPLLRDGVRLVCTGVPFSFAERSLVQNLGVADHVEQRCVTRGEMLKAFEEATLFIYPSRCEGFGLPILDAFAMGCPVVLSDCACFREVAGEAAAFFELDDINGFRGLVHNLLNDSGIRDVLRERGFSRIQHFSWDAAVEKLVGVYERVCQF